MFTARWRLFRVAGIPVYVDLSWLIILALVTATLGQLFTEQELGLSLPGVVGLALATALVYFACIVLHEFGHAFAGRAMGLEYRGITLFLFGGVAELADEPPTAASEFIMAIAGPIVSAVLAGIFWGLALVTPVPWLAYAFLSVAVINAVVLVFNLVPAFPLDGGRVLRSILWGLLGSLRRSTRWASLLGQGFAWVLILLGVFRLFWGADILGGMW